jgi:hypothetical protein
MIYGNAQRGETNGNMVLVTTRFLKGKIKSGMVIAVPPSTLHGGVEPL